ncbi:hypothetical protein [Lysinibacillus sp. NPDC056232]|uniref:hypothetical protein n=1 Tax=Lysinibacillus sp. NPDC056232 TaxID=3345756 RepID=UPI0035DBD7EC
MKKFRGKKRYFHNLSRELDVAHYDLDFGEEGWFDIWHTHLDFYGLGDSSLKLRRAHIKAHIILYNRLLKNLQVFEKPYQSWIELVDEDAGLDGVYIHTSNPNDNNFPLKLENIEWDYPIPKQYKDLINLNEFNVGHYTGESNHHFIIQSKNNEIRL